MSVGIFWGVGKVLVWCGVWGWWKIGRRGGRGFWGRWGFRGWGGGALGVRSGRLCGGQQGAGCEIGDGFGRSGEMGLDGKQRQRWGDRRRVSPAEAAARGGRLFGGAGHHEVSTRRGIGPWQENRI